YMGDQQFAVADFNMAGELLQGNLCDDQLPGGESAAGAEIRQLVRRAGEEGQVPPFAGRAKKAGRVRHNQTVRVEVEFQQAGSRRTSVRTGDGPGEDDRGVLELPRYMAEHQCGVSQLDICFRKHEPVLYAGNPRGQILDMGLAAYARRRE